MIKVAIHQNNFCPWLPFFYKMAMVDKFILIPCVQFEKNGYQNRFKYKDKWVTKPVHNKTESIFEKDYIGLETPEDKGHSWNYGAFEGSVSNLNTRIIRDFADVLNIKTSICNETYIMRKVGGYDSLQSPTEYLIDVLKYHKADVYITNSESKNKYLDESLMKANGIEIEYCKVPKHLQIHTFEAFEKWGIEGTIKQLPRRINAESKAVFSVS